MPTQIAAGVEYTNFGPEPGAATVTNIAVPSSGAGAVTTITVKAQDAVPINQADLIVARLQAQFDFKILSVMATNKASVATADWDLYNATDAVLVINNTVVASATASIVTTFSAAKREYITKSDELQFRSTTDGTGTITDLAFVLTVQVLGAPDNL